MELKKRRQLKIIPFLIFCSFLVLVLGTGYVLANQFFSNREEPFLSLIDDEAEEDPFKDRMNFLLLGVDAREGETKTRTDSVILVSVDKEHNRVAMISLPRDTRVDIPGHGYDKLNAANVYGGPELVMETVSELTGVKIDHYLLTNIQGFEYIVDVIGGVTIDVEKRMYYYDPHDEPELQKIDLQPGVQKLDGNKALQYVRFRSDTLGDVSRTERQQKFLKALIQEMLQPSTITKIPKLVTTISKYMETNLGVTQMMTLAKAAQNLSNLEIVTQTMPGKFLNMDGVSYWSVDSKQAKLVAESIIQDGKVYDVVLGEENVNTKPAATEIPKLTDKEAPARNSNPTLIKEPEKTNIKTNPPLKDGSGRKNGEGKKEGKSPRVAPKETNVESVVDPPKESGEQNSAEPVISAQSEDTPTLESSSDSNSYSWLPSEPL